MSNPNFKQSLAGKADTGRACPYCRFPLKEGVHVAVCEACGAAHHSDCWHDNGGCAILACPGGPTAPGSTLPVDAAYQPSPTEANPQHAFAAPPPPPLPAAERRGPSLAIAVFVLAVAVGGAAVAILLSGRGTSNVRVANVTTAQTVTSIASQQSAAVSTPQEVTSTSTPSTPTPSTEGDLPNVSSEQMQQEIQQMLREWHQDVVYGDYHGAWELLSARKRAQDKREEGYGTWAKNQSTLRPYLNPANLQVAVESTDPDDGVAQVDVTGMGWDKPGASCTEWSGITWVKYENGAWRYDPGYSTTRQREREWKPRFSELLGGSC
jgi:hypothetical protein